MNSTATGRLKQLRRWMLPALILCCVAAPMCGLLPSRAAASTESATDADPVEEAELKTTTARRKRSLQVQECLGAILPDKDTARPCHDRPAPTSDEVVHQQLWRSWPLRH